MANTKKPPVVAPAKPATPAPVAAAPAVVKPSPVPAPAPVAPVLAKPVLAPVAAKPVVAAAAPAKVEPVKAPVVKPAPAVVAPVVKAETPAVAKVAAPVVTKPVAPVAIKPAAPVLKPVEAPKAVEKPKAPVVAKPVEAPKTVAKPAPKPAKPASALPVIDLMKPVAALQENVRANTEKALTEFRGRYAEVKGIAETATSRLEDSMKAAQSGSREIGVALFEIVKAQTTANLDHAKTLAGAKSLPELMNVQQAFVLSQFNSAQTRAKDVAELAGKVASNVTSPLRASFEMMLRR